jgi:hypothetical protein
MLRRRALAAISTGVIALVAAGVTYRFSSRSGRFDPTSLENYYRLLSVRPAHAVDAGSVRSGILSAASYLKRVNRESGQFTYLVNTNPAVPVAPGYDMVRHAGAIYALGLAQSVLADPEIVAVMKRAVDFMRRCCFTRIEGEDMLGLAQPESLTHVAGVPIFELGGAGVGLAALASLAGASPGSVPIGEMRSFARFGQFLQRGDGEFYARFVPSEGGRVWLGKTLFYPGEMALGWLMLYEAEPSADLIESTVAGLEFLARKRARSGAAPVDHWALLATARLFQIADFHGIEIPREALFNHALQICHAILEEGYGPVMLPVMEGALVSYGRGEVTPTATRLEGLLAALTFLPPSHPITPHAASAVHRGMGFVLRAQLKDGRYAGGVPRNISVLAEDGTAERAKFNAEATEIRMDYVQHSMSAMVQYLRWTTDRSSPAGSPLPERKATASGAS